MRPIPAPPNLQFDVYAGYNAASPYPQDGIRPRNALPLFGSLRHHVKAGRFGYQMPQPIFWMHNLYVPLGTNIQDAYKAQLGVGAYHAFGSWRHGVQAGAGLEVPVTARAALFGGVAAHFARGHAGTRDLHWLDAALGFRFALP